MHDPRRITPEEITTLRPGEVFVFGSNYGGRHSKGAALLAKQFGAVSGVSEGLMGASYGLPTKPHDVRLRLSLKQIEHHVEVFHTFTKIRPDLHFLVTAIGCGLAGYTAVEIAPLFRDCAKLSNVALPLSFWRVLGE